MSSVLDSLFSELGPSGLLTNYWPDRPFFQHGPLGRFEGLSEIEPMQNIPEILRRARGRVRVQLSTPGWSDPVLTVAPSDGEVAFDHGLPVYLEQCETWLPPVARYLRSIAQSLLVPIELTV